MGEGVSAELPDIRPQPTEAPAAASETAGSSTDRSTVIVMIVASADVLALGLVFAAVFRKKIDL